MDGKGDFADMIKIMNLKWREDPGLSRWARFKSLKVENFSQLGRKVKLKEKEKFDI